MHKWHTILIIALCLIIPMSPIAAQPLLPDITGTSVNGINTLTWTNQYAGLRGIKVLRSSDSVLNYSVIGVVYDLRKGVQTFTDSSPLPSVNWYRLDIVFNASFTSGSNHFKLLTNNSSDIANKAKDTTQAILPAKTDPLNNKKHKINIILSPDTTVSDAATYFKSRYIKTDPQSGHINIDLPEVKKYHYVIRFYDQNNKMVLEVPRLQTSPVLLDKRNFQKKGIYRFLITKEKKNFDMGYVIIN